MTQQTDPKTADKKNFKDTLNLPRTSFPMRANLVQNEPATLKRWAKVDLYQQIRDARAGAPRFVFHDGPPYANGTLHLGHLLNKCMKDFVVRSKTMAGFDCSYIPGWDCHGLPIEHKVMQELQEKMGDKAAELVAPQIRKRCADYAKKFIKLQSAQMQRLLTSANYDEPYLTMNPLYEAAVLEVFAELVAKGLVYRALKPVHWSIENRTALAEAELEYHDREDTSVYVLFEVEDKAQLPSSLHPEKVPADEPVHLMIWTTTPWTLPANMAVAVSPTSLYSLVQFEVGGRTVRAILAEALVDKVLAAGGAGDLQRLGQCTGQELADAGVTYRHPFLTDRDSRPVVTADYVTLEDGTGLVHTAPGHGADDYHTGLREGLDIYCPVREDGTFDATAPDWLRGKVIWEANDLVVDRLKQSGHMFHAHKFTHSYPHDWRGKSPVIFRATEQWFVGVDQKIDAKINAKTGDSPTLRDAALDCTRDEVTFIPAWGRNRMRGMLETRPDWCLSRQRAWGLPIPAFFPPEGHEGEPLLTAASIRAVSAYFAKHGSDAWFQVEPHELLEGYDPAADRDAPAWLKSAAEGGGVKAAGLRKSTDIFDVWFESGSSWHACMRRRGLAKPDDAPTHTDLYLEGSDQHRGWFQLSLLPSLGATGKPPFATVLTHGFMVAKDGRAMSKSLGNTLEVEDLLKAFGADVCRWWVASINADNDIKVDLEFFKTAGEQYRKVRNTLRFLLSNLSDFDPTKDTHEIAEADAASLDAWMLDRLRQVIADVTGAYEKLAFRRAHERLFELCNDTLSAVYLAAVKDRLYCDKADSPRRRRAQTVLYRTADALIRLLAPILPHTADEAWAALHACEGVKPADMPSVHLQPFPDAAALAAPVDAHWPAVIEARDVWLKAIEDARADRDIDNPLDIGLVVPRSERLAGFDPVDLADLCGISRFEPGDVDQPTVTDLRDQPRCERSWKRDGTVRQRSNGDWLSDRDAAAIDVS